MRHDWQNPLPHELTAHRIKVELARLEQTQHWLADQLHVAPSTINRKMNLPPETPGGTRWKQSELVHMAHLFNIPVEQLQHGHEQDDEATA